MPPALLTALLLTGCSGSRLEPRNARAEVLNYPVSGVVGFGEGGFDHQILFAFRDAKLAAWSTAPAIRVPGSESGAMTSAGLADSAHRPLLVILRAYGGERPYVRASLLAVGSAAPSTAVRSLPDVRLCLGDSWLSAFFIDGLGPVPHGPVVVDYIVEGTTYRLRVDPREHTVRAAPALQLTLGDVYGDATPPERRVMSFEPSHRLAPVLPLVVRRDARRWIGSGGVAANGRFGTSVSEYPGSAPTLEWRFYMLDAPPVC